jgi:cobalt-zinc-cadmium efflux system outer membrane protein
MTADDPVELGSGNDRAWPSALAAALAGALLSACASYSPAPLNRDADAALREHDLRAVAAAASGLRHPRLKPVAIDLAQPLTPEALGLIAVIANPDLKAARAKARVADAQTFAAGLLPDPIITLGFDRILSGPDTTNPVIGQLALDLAAFRDLGVTRAAARAAGEQARLDLAWQEWQIAGQARLLASRIASLERISAIDQDSQAKAETLLTAVLEAAARGDVRAEEVEARRIAAADAADRARQAERDLGAAWIDLDKLLGLAPGARLRIAETSPASPPLDAQALFQRARAERLDLRALEAGYDSQEAVVRKAVLDQFPSLQLTLTRQVDSTGNQLFGPSVNFTAPVWNRNQGGVAIAKATRDQLRAEYAARLLSARSDIAELVDGLTIARRQRAEAAARIEPLSRTVAAANAAAARGDLARAVAETARQSLADKQLSQAVLDQSIAEQTVALEIAIGAVLSE